MKNKIFYIGLAILCIAFVGYIAFSFAQQKAKEDRIAELTKQIEDENYDVIEEYEGKLKTISDANAQLEGQVAELKAQLLESKTEGETTEEGLYDEIGGPYLTKREADVGAAMYQYLYTLMDARAFSEDYSFEAFTERYDKLKAMVTQEYWDADPNLRNYYEAGERRHESEPNAKYFNAGSCEYDDYRFFMRFTSDVECEVMTYMRITNSLYDNGPNWVQSFILVYDEDTGRWLVDNAYGRIMDRKYSFDKTVR